MQVAELIYYIFVAVYSLQSVSRMVRSSGEWALITIKIKQKEFLALRKKLHKAVMRIRAKCVQSRDIENSR